MRQLIGEEVEKDNEFWGHGVWDDQDEEDFGSDDGNYTYIYTHTSR
jgi:hypothetical protein